MMWGSNHKGVSDMARTVTARLESVNPVRDVIDLGIRTVVTIRDEVVDRTDNLADEIVQKVESFMGQGDALRKKGLKRVAKLQVWSRRVVRRQIDQIGRTASKKVDCLLHAVNLASTGDVQKIQQRLEALTAKLEALESARG